MGILQGLCCYNKLLYAAWKGEVGDDRLFYSNFNGVVWDSQATIAGNSSVGLALAVFNGSIFAAWKGELGDERIFFAKYNGYTWTPQAQIPNVASSIGPQLAAFQNKLYAAWKGGGNDQRLWYASFDGSTWSAQKQIPNVASSIGPSLAVFNNKLYAAWKGMGNDQRLWYASFDGSTWSAQKQIPSLVASSIGPSLSECNSKLYAAWKGGSNDQRLWYASFDGSTWSKQAFITYPVASSIGPSLSEYNGKLYAMWKGGGNDQRLWYASFDEKSSTWSEQASIPGNSGQDIDLTLVWIGDVHFEHYRDANGMGQPTAWNPQLKWIVDHKDTYNIRAVLCAGDIQAMKIHSTFPVHFQTAWANNNGTGNGLVCIDDSGLPYLVAAGNHDYTNLVGRDTSAFDANLGHHKIKSKPWYVSCWKDLKGGNTLATQAIKFDVGSRHFLVISLECFPRNSALSWAKGIINDENYLDYEVIIITHAYMRLTGDLAGDLPDTDPGWCDGPAFWGFTDCQRCSDPGTNVTCANNGVTLEIWAQQFPNVKAILCGHSVSSYGNSGPNEAHRIDTAKDGHTFVGIFADYQTDYTLNAAGHPSYSQVVLLLELSGSLVNVRAFNTTTGVEETNNFPYVLPW